MLLAKLGKLGSTLHGALIASLKNHTGLAVKDNYWLTRNKVGKMWYMQKKLLFLCFAAAGQIPFTLYYFIQSDITVTISNQGVKSLAQWH